MLRALAAILACAAPLAACGEKEPPPPELPAGAMLDRASQRLPLSGVARIDLRGRLPQAPAETVTVELKGPFAARSGAIPEFDLEGEAEAAGFGVEGELVSTGDDAYVVFFGENYRVGGDRVAALGPRVEMVEPREWLGPPRYTGAEEVEGTQSYRIEAGLEPGFLTDDLQELGVRLPEGAGLDGGTIAAWVGADDGVLRRLEISSEALDLDLVLSELGEPQEIGPPPGGGFQPIEELLERIPGS